MDVGNYLILWVDKKNRNVNKKLMNLSERKEEFHLVKVCHVAPNKRVTLSVIVKVCWWWLSNYYTRLELSIFRFYWVIAIFCLLKSVSCGGHLESGLFRKLISCSSNDSFLTVSLKSIHYLSPPFVTASSNDAGESAVWLQKEISTLWL